LSRASFEGLEVVARDQRAISFADALGDRTAVAVFLRHFGCIGCTQQINDLVPRLPELDALGVRVVLVGNGDPPFIDEFMRRHNLLATSVVVVTDPSLATYKAAGFDRSTRGTFGLGSIVRRLRAAGKGATGYGGSGDLLQQGGAVVFAPDGSVALHYASHAVGDNVDVSDVVGVALRLQGAELEGVV
jgi:peroxiredoxin